MQKLDIGITHVPRLGSLYAAGGALLGSGILVGAGARIIRKLSTFLLLTINKFVSSSCQPLHHMAFPCFLNVRTFVGVR